MPALLLFVPGSNVPSGYAQPGRYNGPSVRLERAQREPPLYDECNRLSQKTGREVLACSFGVDEARRTAMRYGGGHGRIHGYLRGFSWGLHRMAGLTANDAWALNQGARAAGGMDHYLNSAVQLGQQQGGAQGSAAGSRLAVERFAAAIDSGSFPSSQFTPPAVSYAGEENGYERFVDKNGPRSPQQILRDELGSMNSRLRAYDDLDSEFIDNAHRLPLWEAWHDDGIYPFEPKQGLDANEALKVWMGSSRDPRSRFRTLNNPPLTEPILDRDGKPVMENQRPKERTIDLQQVFRASFIKAYGYYAHYYFSREFYRALDEGQMEGELVGIELGKKLAYQKGLIDSFNEKFKESSVRAFQSAYENTCRASFKTTFEDYAANPKLSIDSIAVIGLKEDGIIQPGEDIAVTFKVTNSGGRPASMRASLGGDVIERRTITLDAMPALAARTFKTPAIAVIDPQLHTGTNANLLLVVNEKEIPHAERVLTPIQITSSQNTLETSIGSARTLIAVQNITTLPAAGEVKVNLILPGKALEQVLGAMDARQTKEAALDIRGLDPLDLIKGIYGRVEVTMNDRLMSDLNIQLVSPDVKRELTAYFDQLIRGQGLVPPAVPTQDRIAEIRKMILNKNLAEVSSDIQGNPWKDNKSSTVMGLLVQNFNTDGQTSATRKIYAELGRDLWEHRKELGKVLFFRSDKRKEYESLCKELMQRK